VRISRHLHFVAVRHRFEDFCLLRAIHDKAADRTVMQAEDGMVDKEKRAGNTGSEFDNRRAACRNESGLQSLRGRRDQIALTVHAIEYLADQVE